MVVYNVSFPTLFALFQHQTDDVVVAYWISVIQSDRQTLNTQSSNSLKTILFSWFQKKNKKKKIRIRTDKKLNEWREIDLIIFLKRIWHKSNKFDMWFALIVDPIDHKCSIEITNWSSHLFTNLVEFLVVKRNTLFSDDRLSSFGYKKTNEVENFQFKSIQSSSISIYYIYYL